MAYRGPERRSEPCSLAFDCPQEEKVNKMFQDIYFGDGPENPPVTTRLLLIEKAVSRFEKTGSKIGLLLLAAILTGIGDIVVHAFTK